MAGARGRARCPRCRKPIGPSGRCACFGDPSESANATWSPLDSGYRPSKPSTGWERVRGTRDSVAAQGRLGPGSNFGNYEIEGLLGTGAMSAVYRARHRVLGHRVALKILSSRIAADKDMQTFLAEAQATAGLKHDNLVEIKDAGLVGGRAYLALELVEGKSLAELLSGGARLGLEPACRMARDVSRGLQAAHARGVIHRDIKPQNILIDAEGRAKICDFGLAHHQATDADINDTGVIYGTPQYMPPEQFGPDPVDHRADLYALGGILYEALSGRRAFEGTSPVEFMRAHAVHAPPSLTAIEGEPLPGELTELLSALLAKKPKDRPASAAVVAKGLESLLRRAASGEDLTRPPDEPGEERNALADLINEKTELAPRSRGRRLGALQSLGLLLLIGAGLGAGFTLPELRRPVGSADRLFYDTILRRRAPRVLDDRIALVAAAKDAEAADLARLAEALKAAGARSCVVSSALPGAEAFEAGVLGLPLGSLSREGRSLDRSPSLDPHALDLPGLRSLRPYVSSTAPVKTATPLGFIGQAPDEDGVTRRAPLFVDYNGRLLPSAELVAALSLWEVPRDRLRYDARAGALIVPRQDRAATRIPLDPSGCALLNFPGSAASFSIRPATSVLEAAAEERARRFKDRLVLVGRAEELESIMTPVDRELPRLCLRATAAANLLDERFIRSPAYAPMALAGIAALLVALILALVRQPFGALCALAVPATSALGCYLALGEFGLWCPPTLAIGGAVLAAVSGSVLAAFEGSGPEDEA